MSEGHHVHDACGTLNLRPSFSEPVGADLSPLEVDWEPYDHTKAYEAVGTVVRTGAGLFYERVSVGDGKRLIWNRLLLRSVDTEGTLWDE